MSLSKDGGSPYVAVVRQAHHWVGGLADRSAPTAASTTLFNLLGGLRPARKLPLHCVPPHIVGEPFGIGAKLRAKLEAWQTRFAVVETRGDAGSPPPARAAVAWEEDGRGCLFGNRGAVAGSRRPARVSSRPRLPSPQGLTARGLPFGTRVRRLLGCSHASARRSRASGERILPGCSRQCHRVGPERGPDGTGGTRANQPPAPSAANVRPSVRAPAAVTSGVGSKRPVRDSGAPS